VFFLFAPRAERPQADVENLEPPASGVGAKGADSLSPDAVGWSAQEVALLWRPT
jgi:hypothetical protein